MFHGSAPLNDPTEDTYHIFLSYSRADMETMQRVKAALEAEGLRVWIDEGIEPGTPVWEMAIETAIAASDCLVVILSPDAAESRWVRSEIEMAESHGKRVFPLLWRGSDRDAVPLRLRLAQRIDIRGATDFDPGMVRLHETICGHLEIESRSQREARLAVAAQRRVEETQRQAWTQIESRLYRI